MTTSMIEFPAPSPQEVLCCKMPRDRSSSRESRHTEHGTRGSRHERAPLKRARSVSREERSRSRERVDNRRRRFNREDGDQGDRDEVHRARHSRRRHDDQRDERHRRRSRSRSRSPRSEHRRWKYHYDEDKDSHRSSSHRHDRNHRDRRRSTSNDARRRRRRSSRSASPQAEAAAASSSSAHRSRAPLPSQEQSLRAAQGRSPPPPPKEKANYNTTGLLAAETNKVTFGSGPEAKHVVLKYHEPPEARKPPSREAWQMFVFKGSSGDPLATVPLHERSCWLLGRESLVADMPLEHPSCSQQHAVLQFRSVTRRDEFGDQHTRVGLYLLDLESRHGTRLNGEQVEGARYVGLRSGDVLRFGESTREYVVMLPPSGAAKAT